jgi:hypothetical protein
VRNRRMWLAVLSVPIVLGMYLEMNAAEKSSKFDSIIEKAIKELHSISKLSIEKTPKSYTATTAKIVDLSPCNASVPEGNVTIEMSTELYASSNASNNVLFIQYLFCVNQSSGQLVLKQADSILLDPGSGVCGLPSAQLNNLPSATYLIVGRITTRNPDGTETIQDEKSCEFRVP